MKIMILDLLNKLQPDVRRVGGIINPDDIEECCFAAKFNNHELQTLGNYILITDNKTNEKLIVYKGDFFNIDLS